MTSDFALANVVTGAILAVAIITLFHIRQKLEAFVLPLILLRAVPNAAFDRFIQTRKSRVAIG